MDLRVRFSIPWTLVNCLESSIIMAIVSYLVTCVAELHSAPDSPVWFFYFTPPMVLHLLGVICTLLFIWFDHIFCCCDCWRGQQEVVVYDPDHPEACLVWKDGEIIDKQDEEETEKEET